MNKSNLVYIPHMNKTLNSKYTRGKTGRGVGAVLLDNGMGGQSSYTSLDNYLATTNAPVPVGRGLKGLEQIRSKMEALQVQQPMSRKPKNIKFTL